MTCTLFDADSSHMEHRGENSWLSCSVTTVTYQLRQASTVNWRNWASRNIDSTEQNEISRNERIYRPDNTRHNYFDHWALLSYPMVYPWKASCPDCEGIVLQHCWLAGSYITKCWSLANQSYMEILLILWGQKSGIIAISLHKILPNPPPPDAFSIPE